MHQAEYTIRPHRHAEMYEDCATAAHHLCPAGRPELLHLPPPRTAGMTDVATIDLQLRLARARLMAAADRLDGEAFDTAAAQINTLLDQRNTAAKQPA